MTNQCLLKLEVDKSLTMDLLHKDVPLPNGTHIYVLHMDGLGRMPNEVMNILSDIGKETIIANIINIRGEKLYTLIYKKNSTVITYDLKLQKVIIESSYWEDLFVDSLLNSFFNILLYHKDRLSTIETEGLTKEWWYDKNNDEAKQIIADYRQGNKHKEFIAKLIVATMDELDITIKDIGRIREKEDYKLLRNRYTHLIEELVKF